MLFVFFCNIIIPKHFFAWFYYIDRLNFFFFVYYIFNCSICIGFCWIVFVSIDCFLLSLLALNAILFSSVHALCFSVLNLCFFYDFFYDILIHYLHYVYFFLGGLFVFQVDLLLEKFYNLQIYLFVLWKIFLCLLVFYFHHYHLLNSGSF